MLIYGLNYTLLLSCKRFLVGKLATLSLNLLFVSDAHDKFSKLSSPKKLF